MTHVQVDDSTEVVRPLAHYRLLYAHCDHQGCPLAWTFAAPVSPAQSQPRSSFGGSSDRRCPRFAGAMGPRRAKGWVLPVRFCNAHKMILRISTWRGVLDMLSARAIARMQTDAVERYGNRISDTWVHDADDRRGGPRTVARHRDSRATLGAGRSATATGDAGGGCPSREGPERLPGRR
jgi:hypothetical protein